MIKRLAGTLVLVFGIAAFATSAYAGNGNGNGHGNGKPDAGPAATDQGAAPGNSGNAPGHTKKDDAPVETTTTVASVATATVADSGAPAGVKPSSTTDHETHAAASSDDTKLYGNGKTAGEIAIRNGAPPNTILHGPGNSQPHKAAPCSGGHERDVHALKGKHGAGCGTPPSPPPGPNPTPNPNPAPGPSPNPGGGPTPGPELHGSTDSSPPSEPGSTPAPAGKPLDPVPASPGKPGPVAVGDVQVSAGVLAQVEFVGQGDLPFTGFPLWIAVVVGVTLLLLGLGLQRWGRPSAF